MLIEYGLGCHGGKSSDFACITEQAAARYPSSHRHREVCERTAGCSVLDYSAGACYRARRRRDPVASMTASYEARLFERPIRARKWKRTLHPPHHPSACRTPRPSMKRSLICTGSRRVVPTPGLSSIRTPISMGPDADSDRSISRSKSSSSAAQALSARPQPAAIATMSDTAAAGVGCAPVIW